MVELTVLCETRCEEAYERKMVKYTEKVVVGVPDCFPWRKDAEDSQINRYGECSASWESRLGAVRGLLED